MSRCVACGFLPAFSPKGPSGVLVWSPVNYSASRVLPASIFVRARERPRIRENFLCVSSHIHVSISLLKRPRCSKPRGDHASTCASGFSLFSSCRNALPDALQDSRYLHWPAQASGWFISWNKSCGHIFGAPAPICTIAGSIPYVY